MLPVCSVGRRAGSHKIEKQISATSIAYGIIAREYDRPVTPSITRIDAGVEASPSVPGWFPRLRNGRR
jgi:hypothetical protein